MRLSIRTALSFFVSALAAPAFAQSITGTWQGTLPSGPGPRLVINVVHLSDGSLHATMFRPDTMGLSGQPFSLVHVADGHVDMTIDLAGTNLTGTVSADGKSISGTWREGKQSSPVTLRLAAPAEYWMKFPTHMDPHADPSFEVATIRPSAPNDNNYLFKPHNHLFRARHFTVVEMIKFAYNLETRQVEGLPAWCSNQPFDITAEADTPGDPIEDQTRVMLRKLLAERFGLKAHVTQKDLPVYALVVEKAPPKLTPATEMEGDHSNISFDVVPEQGGRAQMVATSMKDFVPFLMHFIPDRQIVDHTGLQGRWDFHFAIPGERVQGSDGLSEFEAAMFRGVESVGLKLQPTHAAVDFLVVEHIEKPTAN